MRLVADANDRPGVQLRNLRYQRHVIARGEGLAAPGPGGAKGSREDGCGFARTHERAREHGLGRQEAAEPLGRSRHALTAPACQGSKTIIFVSLRTSLDSYRMADKADLHRSSRLAGSRLHRNDRDPGEFPLPHHGFPRLRDRRLSDG